MIPSIAAGRASARRASRTFAPSRGRTRRGRCRTNSRRGATDPAQRSYPPVQSVCRALDVLRTVNRLRIASVQAIHEATGFPKPTIVRMLETLTAEGYVARDNMCGGYWVTSRVQELTSGHQGISQIIEAARPFAVELTRRLKWPIGIGALDGDAIAIKFWTGTISPWAHTNTVLGLRPDLECDRDGPRASGVLSGRRARAASAPPARRSAAQLRRGGGVPPARDPASRCAPTASRRAIRRPQPYRTTTLAMPIREGETVHALISISFFTTALAKCEIAEKIVAPLRATTKRIEARASRR